MTTTTWGAWLAQGPGWAAVIPSQAALPAASSHMWRQLDSPLGYLKARLLILVAVKERERVFLSLTLARVPSQAKAMDWLE
jgi:hypothetical protein